VNFIHDDREFDALLRIVADKRKIAVGPAQALRIERLRLRLPVARLVG
jgi:hypothetical protein